VRLGHHAAMADTTSPHRWQFIRLGGLDQVTLQTADDLRHLHQLDQKLWVALSCPVTGLELDQRTLELLDLDHDGRVRAPELLAALAFCEARLADLGSLLEGAAVLPLSALSEARPDGKALRAAARRVLASLGKPDAAVLTPDDVKDLSHVFDAGPLDGDGVVPPEQAGDDAATRQAILDAMACAGPVTGRNGKPGIDRKKMEAFFADLAAFQRWQEDGRSSGALVFGDATGPAWGAVQLVREKVDDHFARCRLAAMDPRGAALLNRTDDELKALGARPLGAGSAELAAFPVARAEAGRALPLAEGLNPAWAGPLATLRDTAVKAAFGAGRDSLSEAEWRELLAKLAPCQDWMARRQGAGVEALGPARVRELLGGGARAGIEKLIAEDEALQAEATAVADVARLVHCHRDLVVLLRNFVNFAHFYNPKTPAIFQAGTLYLDGRSCHLCIRVADPAAHANMALGSNLFVAYCELRRAGSPGMKIAACFTRGDSDFVTVGRNGLFYDRQGRDWDATVVRVVDNPIALRQAFAAPYKKFMRMIEQQIARFAAAKEKEADARLAAAAAATVPVSGSPPAPPPAPGPVDVGKMVGIIAALGVGVGAMATFLGGFVSGFIGLQPWWAKLVAVGGVVLIVSGPSMLIAWLKIRQRTLGPLLDATGWAINGRIRINIPLGSALTDLAVLPPGARRSLEDPFEDVRARQRRQAVVLVILLVLAALAVARAMRWWPFQPGGW
jgi:hypothetical protein